MATALTNKLKPERLLAALARSQQSLGERAITVAYSGGRDSHVLLHALYTLGLPVTAVHVHHGLSPNADAWAGHCQEVCEQLAIPLQIKRLKLNITAQQSLEEEARKARYQVFAELTPCHLALAHHANDQAETYLLQLFRGAAEAGLAAMAEVRALNGSVQLWRPLLTVESTQIAAYANAHQLRHIVDESNFNTRYKRNALRQDILPLVEAHFPGHATAISRSASLQQEQLQRIQGLSQLALSFMGDHLPVKIFRQHPHAGADLLRAWLLTKGHRVPDAAKLREWTRQLALPFDPERKIAFTHEDMHYQVKKDFLIRLN